jgi:hypothetical protein
VRNWLVLFFSIAISQLCYAEIKVYQSTDNTGINKKEQIDGIERYLAELGNQLRKMEEKIDASSLKLKNMESAIAVIKEVDLKKIQEQLIPKNDPAKKATGKTSDETIEATGEVIGKDELEKLKADILAIKNNDIEQIRLDLNGLKFSIKNIESILKIPGK